MKRLVFVVAAVLALAPAAAGAQTQREKAIDVFDVDPGLDCTLTAHNGESVWPGNVLVVRTGETEIEVAGVEDAPDILTVVEFVSEGPVSAGVLITEWSSLDAAVECSPPPTTTTTEQETTTTTEATTTTPPTSDCSSFAESPDCTTTTIHTDCVLVRDGDDPGTDCTTTTTEATTTTTSSVPPTTTTTTPPNENCPTDGLACTGLTPLTPILAMAGAWLIAAGALAAAFARDRLRR